MEIANEEMCAAAADSIVKEQALCHDDAGMALEGLAVRHAANMDRKGLLAVSAMAFRWLAAEMGVAEVAMQMIVETNRQVENLRR